MENDLWVPLGPPKAPEVILRESVINSAQQIELISSVLDRTANPFEQARLRNQMLLHLADAMVCMVRLTTKDYH